MISVPLEAVSLTTSCCSVVFRLPSACAAARRRWIDVVDGVLVGLERLAELLGPVRLVHQHLDHLRERRERDVGGREPRLLGGGLRALPLRAGVGSSASPRTSARRRSPSRPAGSARSARRGRARWARSGCPWPTWRPPGSPGRGLRRRCGLPAAAWRREPGSRAGSPSSGSTTWILSPGTFSTTLPGYETPVAQLRERHVQGHRVLLDSRYDFTLDGLDRVARGVQAEAEVVALLHVVLEIQASRVRARSG